MGERFPLFDVHVTVHCAKFLIIKPTRCTDFSNLFLEWNSTCFWQFLCPSSGVFHCTCSNGVCHTGLLTTCEQAVSKPVWHIPLLRVQWKTPDDGQRNCPKHVEFHSKNKFEKSVHLVGFIIRKFPLYWKIVVLSFSESVILLGLLDPGVESTTVLCYIGAILPVDALWQSKWHDCSVTPLWEPQILFSSLSVCAKA